MKNNIKINVENIEVEAIKEILWELCYNPEEAMEELEIKVDNPKNLINLILEECKNSAKELNFAGERPYLDTYCIDIGISNPVVRDIILEHCYVAFEKEVSLQNSPERAIEKIIKLLKTQDSNENFEKRVFGGLRALGFNYEEAQYLKSTCNLYPVALVLERMVLSNPRKELLDEDFENAFSNSVNEEENENSENVIKVSELLENAAQAKTVQPTVLLENKSEVEELYRKLENFGNISSYDDLAKEFVSIQNEMEKLQEKIEKIAELKDIANKLEKKGIPFDYLLDNDVKVISLFDAVANL